MEKELYIPQMILIGSAGRNSGKTTLATALIEHFKTEYSVVGLKVTTIKERDGKCPRGGKGCGVCTSIDGEHDICEEKNINGNKDTSLLLSAGARKVYWLKTLKESIYSGFTEVMSSIDNNEIIVCESNSLRNIIKPGIFFMLHNSDNIKQSAQEVIDKADLILRYDIRNDINSIINKIKVEQTQNGFAISIQKEDNFNLEQRNLYVN